MISFLFVILVYCTTNISILLPCVKRKNIHIPSQLHWFQQNLTYNPFMNETKKYIFKLRHWILDYGVFLLKIRKLMPKIIYIFNREEFIKNGHYTFQQRLFINKYFTLNNNNSLILEEFNLDFLNKVSCLRYFS
jgi:hypothetical protein